jgi:hypothetical protein
LTEAFNPMNKNNWVTWINQDEENGGAGFVYIVIEDNANIAKRTAYTKFQSRTNHYEESCF